MSYRSRSVRRAARHGTRKFILTTALLVFLAYAMVMWGLPVLVNGVSSVASIFRTPVKQQQSVADSEVLAPPVLVVPFEATNNSEIVINGYATSELKVKIYVDDQLKDIADVAPDGNFSSEKISLLLGKNIIYAKTTDEKDRESLPSKTIEIIYDNEKPSLTVDQPEDNKEVKDERKIIISGKTDSEATIYVNDMRLIIDSEGKFSSPYTLQDGENNLVIKAQDKAGNTTEISRKVTFTTDIAPTPTP